MHFPLLQTKKQVLTHQLVWSTYMSNKEVTSSDNYIWLDVPLYPINFEALSLILISDEVLIRLRPHSASNQLLSPK